MISTISEAAMSQFSEDDPQNLSINAWLPRVTAGLDSDADKAKAMVPYLEDLEPYVRQLAVECIAELRMPEYGALLSECLSDTEGFVRASAAEAVNLLDYRPAVPQLVRLLQSDYDELARICAAEALGNLSDTSPVVIDVLVTALRRDPNELVRAYAAESLGLLGAAETIDALKQRLRVEDSERAAASILTALSLLGDDASLETFALLVVDESPGVVQSMVDIIIDRVPSARLRSVVEKVVTEHPLLTQKLLSEFFPE